MTVELVKSTTGGGWAGVSPLTIPISTTSGNALVLSTTITAGATPTVADTAGNVWVKAASTVDVGAAGQRRGCVYYCIDAAAVTSVSVTSASNQNWSAVVSEWSGVESFRGAVAANTPSGSTPVAAEAGDLVVSSAFYYEPDFIVYTAPTGWGDVGGVAPTNNVHSSAYQIATASGNVGAAWTMPASARAVITTAFVGTPLLERRPWKRITASGHTDLRLHRL